MTSKEDFLRKMKIKAETFASIQENYNTNQKQEFVEKFMILSEQIYDEVHKAVNKGFIYDSDMV